VLPMELTVRLMHLALQSFMPAVRCCRPWQAHLRTATTVSGAPHIMTKTCQRSHLGSHSVNSTKLQSKR
jgi:hypothetical protein